MNRRNLWIALAVVVVLAAIGGLFLWRSVAARSRAGEVRTAVVQRGTLQVAVTASGRIEPAAEVDLSFDLPGRVVEVLVDLGDVVREGQPLARLDPVDARAAVQRAEAALMAAQAQLSLLESGARSEEIAVSDAQLEAAQAALAQAIAQRDQVAQVELTAAQAQLASTEVEEWLARDLYERKGWIVGNIATLRLRAAEASLAAAEARLAQVDDADGAQIRAADAAVWAAAAQRDVAQAQLDLLQAGATDEEIATAEAKVIEAEASLEAARSDLENTTLTAPFDGAVAAVNVTPGETAPTGVPAVSLVDPSQFHITVGVDEIDVAVLRLGLPAEITVDALPDLILTGAVERIGPAASLDQGAVSYPVVVALDPADAPIRTGMSATAVISVEELSAQLLIPNWLVRIDETTGQAFVYRQTSDGTERVDVRLGVRYEGTSQVLEGLEEGDVLVLVQSNSFFGGP